jgi:hypothetical protein
MPAPPPLQVDPLALHISRRMFHITVTRLMQLTDTVGRVAQKSNSSVTSRTERDMNNR